MVSNLTPVSSNTTILINYQDLAIFKSNEIFMNKFLIGLTVLVIVFVGAYYLIFTNPEQQPSATPTSTAEIIKIGAMLPLSGERVADGEIALAGAQLAVKEINDSGGVNGRKLEIVFEDDRCSKEGGVAAMTKLIVVSQVSVVFGSLCPVVSEAANPIAQVAGVPTIIFGAGAPDLTKSGEFIFRAYPTDLAEGRFIAEYLYQSLKKSKAAVVAEKDAYQFLKEAFAGRFKELGGSVVLDFVLSEKADEKELQKLFNELKAKKTETVYLLVDLNKSSELLKKINLLKIRPVVFGSSFWDHPEILTMSEADGVYYAVPQAVNFEEFKTRVKDVLGKDVNRYSVYFYDLVKMLAEVMKRTGTDKRTIRNTLVVSAYSQGASLSTIEFDNDRELKNPLFEVKMVKGGQLVSESNASSSMASIVASSTVSSTGQ